MDGGLAQTADIDRQIGRIAARAFARAIAAFFLFIEVGCSAGGSPDIAAGLAAEKQNDQSDAIRLYSRALASGDLSHDDQAIAHFDRGIAFRKSGQIRRAIGDFDAALRLKPNFPEAYDERGIAKDVDGDVDGAIADYGEAIRQNPNLADAYNNRGYAWQQKRQYDKAILDYDAAVRIQPDNSRAYTNRGSSHQALGQYDKAIDDFSAAILHAPSNPPEAHDSRGLAYKAAGRYDEAIADYNEATRLSPKFALAYAHRALAYHLKGQYERAIADYDTAIQLNADDPDVYGNRGLSRFALGQYSAAAEDFGQSMKLHPTNSYWPIWLHLARAKAGASDAEEFARNTAAIDRTNWPGPVVGLYLGQIAPEQVLAAATEGSANTQRVRNCEAAFFSGEYESLKRNLPAARSLLQQAVEQCPPDFAEYAGVGAELQRVGGKVDVSELEQPIQAGTSSRANTTSSAGGRSSLGTGKPTVLTAQPPEPTPQAASAPPAPPPVASAAPLTAESSTPPSSQMQSAAADLSAAPLLAQQNAGSPLVPQSAPIMLSAAPPQVASVSQGRAWHIQLGAARSTDEAERTWGRLQRAAPNVLGALTLSVQRADLGGSKGVFYRIQAGPFSDQGEAAAACDTLKSAQIDCFTVKP